MEKGNDGRENRVLSIVIFTEFGVKRARWRLCLILPILYDFERFCSKLQFYFLLD